MTLILHSEVVFLPTGLRGQVAWIDPSGNLAVIQSGKLRITARSDELALASEPLDPLEALFHLSLPKEGRVVWRAPK